MANSYYDDQDMQTVRVRDILRSVWKHKFHCGAIVVAFVFLAIIWLTVSAPTYKATMIIMPAESVGGGSSSLANKASEIGSALGLKFGGGEDAVSYFGQSLALMRTVELNRRLDKKYDLKKRVFGSMWDAKTETWHPPQSIISQLKLFVKGLLGYPDWSAPDDSALTTYMNGRLSIIEHEPGTSLKRLEFLHRNREFALEVLTWSFEESDQILRSNLRKSSRETIEYLSSRVESITAAEHREVLFSLILEQERNLVLLEGTNSPGAIVLDPPTASVNPFYPKVTLTLVLSFMVGALAAVGYAFARVLNS